MLGIQFLGESKDGDFLLSSNVECTDVDRTVCMIGASLFGLFVDVFLLALAQVGYIWGQYV